MVVRLAHVKQMAREAVSLTEMTIPQFQFAVVGNTDQNIRLIGSAKMGDPASEFECELPKFRDVEAVCRWQPTKGGSRALLVQRIVEFNKMGFVVGR